MQQSQSITKCQQAEAAQRYNNTDIRLQDLGSYKLLQNLQQTESAIVSGCPAALLRAPGLILLQKGVDGLVLGVEVAHVDHQVFDNKHVRQRSNFCLCIICSLHLMVIKMYHKQQLGLMTRNAHSDSPLKAMQGIQHKYAVSSAFTARETTHLSQACQAVSSVDIHRTRATDTLSAQIKNKSYCVFCHHLIAVLCAQKSVAAPKNIYLNANITCTIF